MVLIYLILCALYESLLIPFSIILSVPCGFLGSFLFAQILGLENNIYMQTGLIMLIGLLAKTAILQTEYAVQRRKAGMSLIQAAYVAAKDRLRPILMTVMAMIFGLCKRLPFSGFRCSGRYVDRNIGTAAICSRPFHCLSVFTRKNQTCTDFM